MALLATNRLKKNADFLGVLREKKNRFEALFGTMIVADRGNTATRFGFVISKKVSPKSTARNLLKRRASEWVRKQILFMRAGLDIVLIFNRNAVSLSRRALYEELERACARAGVLNLK
jgi:ribonuclease P protein component